jgi:hypothetical protein
MRAALLQEGTMRKLHIDIKIPPTTGPVILNMHSIERFRWRKVRDDLVRVWPLNTNHRWRRIGARGYGPARGRGR